MAKCKNFENTEEFHIQEGYLFKGNQLYVPKTSLQIQLIKEMHEGGLSAHFGRDKIFALLEDKTIGNG